MKFQNISIHGSKHAIHNKAMTLNGQKLRRAVTPTFHLIGSKFNQVISSSIPVYQISWLWLKYFLRYLADKVKMPRTTKGHNNVNFSWNSLKTKSGDLHIIPNQHIVFQDPSLSTFRDILLTRSK